MPFVWTHDRAAMPSTSAAPSGRISVSPTQTRGHRRGLPQSTSTSSNLSSISTSARSTSASQQPPPSLPSTWSIPKPATSAALTNADESDDFRRFLDQAQARHDLQRQRQPKKAANLAPGPRRSSKQADRAADSLRRVASSSDLNSTHPQRGAATTNTKVEQSAAPPARVRKNSTLTTASRAPRSVSNYSVTFRNPTSQFLEQLSFDAQTPELGIDDTPITGRAVDSKSHLTALEHAAQIQSRSASTSHSSKNSTIKARAPSSQPQPVRSSTIAVESPMVTSSRVVREPSQSFNSSPPVVQTSTARIASPSPSSRSQPLSPRCRPQSYIHKPPSEPSRLVSPRKLSATRLGHGLPTSSSASPTQAKRSADEMERSSSLQPATLDDATPAVEASSLQQSPCQPSSRRKTWFGLGWAANSRKDSTDNNAVTFSATSAKHEISDSTEPAEDKPPPPMNEEEAAFRRSLGYNDVFDISEDAKGATQSPESHRALPAARDSDATMKAEPSAVQILARERRVSWLPWRNVVLPAEEKVINSNEGSAPQQQGDTDGAMSQAVPEQMTQEEATKPVAQDVEMSEDHDQAESTLTYRTVVKRGWMGARYEVKEPVPALREISIPPEALAPQAETSDTPVSNSVTNDAVDQAPHPQPDQNQDTYPPTRPPEESTRQGSSTWRWRFWSVHEDQPETNEASVAQQLEVPTNSHLSATSNVQQHSGGPDKAEPMDIDQEAVPADAPTAPEGGSWTYSSYLASWVPTWVYNAQQQEAVAAANASQHDTTDSKLDYRHDSALSEAPPRTPAEQVKADALARDSSAAVFDANRAVLNSSTKSGWIKFFGSRSANLPREMPETITNDDGMEIMDVSDMEAPSRPATARAIASSNTHLTADASCAPRSRTATGGSSAGSKASSLAGDAATPLSTSKDSARNLGKAAITKAGNVTAASTLGLGKGKRTDASQTRGTSSNGAGTSSGSQPAKDISKRLAPIGNDPFRSGASTPTKSAADPVPVVPPNLVLPSFEDTFTRAPRMWPPKVGVLERTLSAVNSYLFSKVPDLERMKRPTRFSTYGEANLRSSALSFKGSAASLAGARPTQRLAGKAKATGTGSSKDKGVESALKEVAESAQRLPRAWSTVGMHERAQMKGTAGIGRIVVIGVHGWFTQSIFKNMIGEPTGTSAKFAAMQTESIRRHFLEAGLELNPEAITAISLQGDGKVADRVDRLFSELISRPNWVNDLKSADAVFLSAHSQGAIVATQLLARLIEQRHVLAENTRICLLAMCGIHHGPFAHLKSSITASYINYFETAAAKELFEFQSSATAVSQQYTAALKIILDAGAKCVYVGSTDDNVVPIYSALNASNNHPSILRALYIDGQAFPKVDFLTNLLVLCVAVRNAGLGDHNLLTLLSASVAGSLYGGKGHSLVYEERAVYDLATRYLFEATHPMAEPTFVPGPPGINPHASSPSSHSASSTRRVSSSDSDSRKAAVLVSEAFEAQRWNPYELPWSLRGLFEDKHVRSLFAEDMLNLLQSYEEWKPDAKSKALKDLQWRLAPMKSIKPPPIEEGDGGAQQTEGVSGGSGKNSKL